MATITYIREKTNHKNIIAFGYVGAGGLGEYDHELYEEVVGVAALPNNYVFVTLPSLQEKLGDLFNQLPMHLYSPEQKSVIYVTKTNVQAALVYQDFPTIRWIIENATITPSDPTFDEIRAEMLALLP